MTISAYIFFYLESHVLRFNNNNFHEQNNAGKPLFAQPILRSNVLDNFLFALRLLVVVTKAPSLPPSITLALLFAFAFAFSYNCKLHEYHSIHHNIHTHISEFSTITILSTFTMIQMLRHTLIYDIW